MKAYTDINQSKKLAEILPLESADHHYVRKTCDFMGNPVDGKWSTPKYGNPNSSHANYMTMDFINYEILPCWSLASLLNYLREIDFFPSIEADEHGVIMSACYFDDSEGELLHPIHDITTEADNFVDACYELIIKLHEQNIL